MDKEWSEKNKKMQTLISKEATFSEGINLLLELRGNLFEQISSIINTFPPVAFYQLPFGHGDKTRVNAQFSLEKEILAFPARPEFGEKDY